MRQMTNHLLIVLGIFVVALIIMNMGDYAPYSSQSIFSSSPAEGFENVADLVSASQKAAKDVANLVAKSESVSVNPVSSTILSEKVQDNFEVMNSGDMMLAPSLHYGMVGAETGIDKFSQVSSFGMDGVNGCVSAGMSTDRGSMCLSPELMQLLHTRGGNAGSM